LIGSRGTDKTGWVATNQQGETTMDANQDDRNIGAAEAAPRQARPRADVDARRDYFDDPRRKSPVLALVLSLMPGLGQIYVGYYQQGFLNALIVASTIALLASHTIWHIEPFAGFFLAFFWLYNLVDAWRRAVFYNNALAGLGPAEMPDDQSLPTGRGSMAAGAAMIVVGAVLLSNTLFGFSLQWLERWWPIVFVALGGWLVYQNVTSRK
jgi:TM2 domain-containing membrane protein YozV